MIWFLSCSYLRMGASWYSREITWSAVVPSDQSLAADAAQNRVHAAQLLDLVVDQIRVRGIGEIPLVLRDI